jgi:hypothetical protein
MYKKFLSVRKGASGPLSLLIKKLNKENAPPDGWALPDRLKRSSSQAFKLDRSRELG